ncbi:hypothetical protein Sango_2414200 [Sesamum angolense]|uniref:Retrotransposon gag domain-containing protein n=1 Tax=Sesamum angolense TaxID=2727404 RepID=A0AAE1W7D9_9LAMI|nr:hypothetical protein Sango_2414200 [Sesamum angolense]
MRGCTEMSREFFCHDPSTLKEAPHFRSGTSFLAPWRNSIIIFMNECQLAGGITAEPKIGSEVLSPPSTCCESGIHTKILEWKVSINVRDWSNVNLFGNDLEPTLFCVQGCLLIRELANGRSLANVKVRKCEDPHKHLKEFHVVCPGMRPQGITKEQIKLRAFPFSLADQAKDWLYFLPSGSITTWNDLKRQFLKKYFPASRATTIHKEISGIRQFAGESLFEYWQFGTRYDDPPRKSNEVSIAAFDDRLNELISLVKKLAVERTQHVKPCGICTSPEHVTDMCPTLQEAPTEHADAVGGFFEQQQRRYDLFSNTYNPEWKDHPNLSYGAQSQNFQMPQYRDHMPPSNPKQGTHLEDMIKSLIFNTQQIQQNTQQQIQQLQQSTEHQFQQFQQSVQQFQLSTQTSIQNLESQMSQLASSVSKLESQGKLPSQTVIKPKQNASAIVLRSGKELQEHTDENSTKRGHAQKRKPEKEVEIPPDQDDEAKKDDPKVLVTRPPFPERFTKSKKEEEEKEIFEIFRKVSSKERTGKYGRKRVCDPPTKTTSQMGCHQLANRSVIYPEGVLEDVLVQVNELVFPADFYVLDMREDNSPNSTSILLGRPFLKTARTKIDVHVGTLTMEFDAIDDKDYIKFILEKSPTPMEEGNMGVDPLVQVRNPLTNTTILSLFTKNDQPPFSTVTIKGQADTVAAPRPAPPSPLQNPNPAAAAHTSAAGLCSRTLPPTHHPPLISVAALCRYPPPYSTTVTGTISLTLT